VSTEAQRLRKTKSRVFWERSSGVIHSVENVKRHGIGKIEKRRKEEQRE